MVFQSIFLRIRMSMKSTLAGYPLLWLLAMVPGILLGRYLGGVKADVPVPALSSAVEKRSGWGGAPGKVEPAAETATGSVSCGTFLRVPPAAMRRIEVTLMDGMELDKDECRLLGMTEAQIQRLSSVVEASLARLREREQATVRWLAPEGADKLMYIPPADPELAEQEWKDVTAAVREIGGQELGDLLHFRLTDGYSPSRFSNAGKGMLNVATAGFGTMHRFIKVSTLPDGSSSYEVTDLLPASLKGVPVDATVFGRIGKSVGFDERQTYNSVKDHRRISHLPSP